jgi:putative OmpL-like beta-barrel porin-2
MKNRISRTSPLIKTNGLKTASAFVGLAASGGILVGSAAGAFAQDAATLEKENQDLKARVDALEQIAEKEGLIPSGTPAPRLVSAMTDITISGFVQTSYFYNTRRPADGESDGYLWNTEDNSFSINKVKLTIASKAVDTDKWDAGFRTSLLFGDDAPDLDSPGRFGSTGVNTSFNDLREAYVELNVPVGTGLDIKAGELISLLNWESGDGGAANPNFSQGNQWWFTGNGPSAGIQATYNFTDKVGLTVRVDNGLFQGPVDNNSGKAFSGSISLKPTKDLWLNLIGWYDSEPGTTAVAGGSVIGGDQVTAKLGTGFEVDYFNNSSLGNSTDLWSVGGWIWYDFTAKVDLALRADYVSQSNGVLGPAVRPGAAIISTDDGGDLGSVTLTLNLKPTPTIKIQPEIRYDYTSFSGGLDGKKDRVIIGCGATYLF